MAVIFNGFELLKKAKATSPEKDIVHNLIWK